MDKNLVNELVTSLNIATMSTVDNEDLVAGELELLESFHRKMATAYLDHDGNLPYNGFEVLDWVDTQAELGDRVAQSIMNDAQSDDALVCAMVSCALTSLESLLQECTRVWMVALDIKDVTHKVH
jgi:hypothetical protein